MPKHAGLSAMFFLLCLLIAYPARGACKGEDGGTSVVTEINSGETLILEDGRAVRLIGVLMPRRAREGPAFEARALAEAAIEKLTLGKKVSLQLDTRKRDRYGRILAHVEAVGDTESFWVQSKLVEAGLAKVISFQDNRLCVERLLALEQEARRARKGLWGNGFFSIRSADAQDILYGLAQSYEVVEGRVSSVTEIRGRTYINFGQNWRQDFTAFIPEKSSRLFGAENSVSPVGMSLASLNGKTIRVRGWLKNVNGPSMTVTHPEQIEIIGEDKSVYVPSKTASPRGAFLGDPQTGFGGTAPSTMEDGAPSLN